MKQNIDHITENEPGPDPAASGGQDADHSSGQQDQQLVSGGPGTTPSTDPDHPTDEQPADPSGSPDPSEAPAEASDKDPFSDTEEEEPATEAEKVEKEEQRVAQNEKEEPVVIIKGLKKAFKEHTVLRGVDLYVNKGENLVVLGKSGSGKSVLIKCLVGLEWPDEGELIVFGQDISALNYRQMNELRVRVGFLFQNAALYDSMTVRENLAFPLRQHKKTMTREKKESVIMEMLSNVGLEESIDQMPSKLSGGQSKRIGLARTLILRPELMLYDEPTTGLDTGTAREISELMIKMKQKYNISSITITHDMQCAKMTADRIIMMKEGVVVAEGSYEELEKSDDEWVKSFFLND